MISPANIIIEMSPTVFRWKGYRFFFFSREEKRMHVHVFSPDGEAKFWLEPELSLADNFGLREGQIAQLKQVMEDRKGEIEKAWKNHFRG
jgi:hypothetical protein